jgi:hypothetical protein
MDTISVKPSTRSDDLGLTFVINGRDLIDIIADCGGGDGALTYHVVESFPEWTVFTTERAPDRKIVLVCGCGELACSSTTLMVTRSPESVEWSDIETCIVNKNKRIPIGPYVFAAAEYDEALNCGRQLVSAHRRHHGG